MNDNILIFEKYEDIDIYIYKWRNEILSRVKSVQMLKIIIL